MDYIEYKNNQQVVYRSYESDSKHWAEGQRRFITMWLLPYKNHKILDVACGDGVGLKYFEELGFWGVTGMEFEETKVLRARESDYKVIQQDFHDPIEEHYDLIYSSHSLEHALKPDVVLKNFHDHCNELILVLPYPDVGPIEAHCAKKILGTDKNDDGKAVIDYISNFGFKLKKKQFDSFRETEIWLHFEVERQ
jgi:SAM-dependent methyltransferase